MSDSAVTSQIKRAEIVFERAGQSYEALCRLKANAELDIITGQDGEGNDIVRKKLVISEEVKASLDAKILEIEAKTFTKE